MNICVFCSSSNAIDKIYFDDATELGRIIAVNGHTLVTGGANVGLMEAVTIAAKNAGGHTFGIIPERMQEKNLVSNHAHQVEITRGMMERKDRMRELSDAFIALPGGFGTLEEILEVITLKQLDYHRKAIVFINSGNFFQNLFMQFEAAYDQNFAKQAYRQLYHIAGNPAGALHHIENYQPAELTTKWYRVPER